MGQRGVLKIYNGLFLPHEEKEEGKKIKGRSAKLISQRNECLLDRYLFYGRFSGKRYDLILNKLSAEFFLSESTIAELIDNNYDKLIVLKKAYQDISEMGLKRKLENKWLHLSWRII